jgi:hypothetical protein
VRRRIGSVCRRVRIESTMTLESSKRRATYSSSHRPFVRRSKSAPRSWRTNLSKGSIPSRSPSACLTATTSENRGAARARAIVDFPTPIGPARRRHRRTAASLPVNRWDLMSDANRTYTTQEIHRVMATRQHDHPLGSDGRQVLPTKRRTRVLHFSRRPSLHQLRWTPA